MRSIKKRIFVFMLCFVIVFSNVFFSYETALVVKAQEQDYDLWDAINDVLGIALVTLGIYTVVSTGGVTAPAVLEIGAGLASSGIRADNIYNYIVNNGDGTYTMSEEFINSVLAEAQKVQDAGFHSWKDLEGSGTLYRCKVYGTIGAGRTHMYFDNDVSSRMCVVWDTAHQCYFRLMDGAYSKLSMYCPETGYYYSNSGLSGGDESLSVAANIPIFANDDARAAAYSSGDYTAALNYREKPPFQYGSNYSPTYTGGAVRFSRGVLDGIVDKINEVDQKVDDIDQKLDELNDYIRNGGGAVDDDDPYDDTETTTSTDGWLKKIYNKLVDILKQIKSIKRWTIADTLIDAADAIADWLSLIHDILEDVDNGAESAVATISSALDDATGLLKKKFPFSVPWDILFIVTFFAAEPQTPHFEIPIQFDISLIGVSVDYTLVVDFGDYEYLSKISRTVLSMTYAVGLIKMTAGITSTKKEE